MKLQSKQREGKKVRYVYDSAKTPLQRLLLSGVLPVEMRQELTEVARALDPIRLFQQLEQLQQQFEKSENQQLEQGESSRVEQSRFQARIEELQATQTTVEERIKSLVEALAAETRRREAAEQRVGGHGRLDERIVDQRLCGNSVQPGFGAAWLQRIRK